MGERYERIILSESRFWNVKSPVMLLKWALLKDNQNKHNVLQLKLLNYSEKDILAVSVDINCYDLNKELVEVISYDYLDLNILPNQIFGDREAIDVESRTAREFQFIIKKVFYSDKSNFDVNAKLIDMGSNKSLNVFGKYQEIFSEEYCKICQELKPYCAPEFNEAYWTCSCGRINPYTEKGCIECGIEKVTLEKLSNMDYLKSQYESQQKKLEEQRRAEQERIEEQKRLALEERAKQKEIKRKKLKKLKNKLIVAACICVVCIGFYIWYAKIIEPKNKYSAAIEKMEKGNYEEAELDFQDLGNYNDSERKKVICQVEQKLLQDNPNKAVEILEKNNLTEEDVYKRAVAKQQKKEDYQKNEESYQKNEESYQNGVRYMNRAKLDQAIEWYKKVDLSYKKTEYYLSLCNKYNKISGIYKCTSKNKKDEDISIVIYISISEEGKEDISIGNLMTKATLSGDILTWEPYISGLEKCELNFGTKEVTIKSYSDEGGKLKLVGTKLYTVKKHINV